MNRLALAIATVGGLGRFPIAPGTVGSVVGVGLYLALAPTAPVVQGGVLLGVIAVGTWASGLAARHLGRPDPGPVVIDEVAGQHLTLLLTGAALPGAVLGFFLFRLLDIVKPWPANRLEALPGGLGVMADDLMAALYGNLLLRGLIYAWPGAI